MSCMGVVASQEGKCSRLVAGNHVLHNGSCMQRHRKLPNATAVVVTDRIGTATTIATNDVISSGGCESILFPSLPFVSSTSLSGNNKEPNEASRTLWFLYIIPCYSIA